MTANIKGLVSRGKLTQDKAGKALSLFKGVLDYTEFKDVDMVIEVPSILVICFGVICHSLLFQLSCISKSR